MTGKIVAHLLDAVERDGGVTISWPDLTVPARGWAVADPQHSSLFGYPSQLNYRPKLESVLSEFLLRAPMGRHIGLWIDREVDILCLDVVDLIFDRDFAIALGKLWDQIAIYNLENGETIYCK